MVVITRAASNTARSTLFAQTFHRRVYRAGESDICLVHYFDDAHLISEKSRLAHAAPVPSPAPPPPRTSASGLVEGTSSSMLLDDEEGHVADDDLRLFLADNDLFAAIVDHAPHACTTDTQASAAAPPHSPPSPPSKDLSALQSATPPLSQAAVHMVRVRTMVETPLMAACTYSTLNVPLLRMQQLRRLLSPRWAHNC